MERAFTSFFILFQTTYTDKGRKPADGRFVAFDHLTFWVSNAKQVRLTFWVSNFYSRLECLILK